MVAVGHVLGVVRLDRNADTQSSDHCGGGVWWHCVSDRLVRGQNVRRTVLRDELPTQRVVGMDCVLKDVWRWHALAITHCPDARIVRRHVRRADRERRLQHGLLPSQLCVVGIHRMVGLLGDVRRWHTDALAHRANTAGVRRHMRRLGDGLATMQPARLCAAAS